MEWFQQIFLAPLESGFMQRAILTALILGTVNGVIGVYVVTRGMAFLGDAIAHSVLPGVAVAFLNRQENQSNSLLLGGLIAGILSAIVIGLLSRGKKLREDTAIGIVFSGSLALGIVMISTNRSNFVTDLTHVLTGDILTVSWQDVMTVALISAVILGLIVIFYKELLITSFDATFAETLHLPSEALRFLLLIMLAVTIVISIQSVGVALVAAMLVTPAATARFLTPRFHVMAFLSGLIGSLSGLMGMYISWHLQIASSATIVLVMTCTFLLLFAFSSLNNRRKNP